MTTVVDVRLEEANLLAAVEHGEVSVLVAAPEHVSEAELETATDAAIEALVDQVERQSVVDRGDGVATDGGSEKERASVYRDAPCPDCDHGRVEIADAVYAECDNCDAAVLRTEVGI